MAYRNDRKWSNKYLPQVSEILKENAGSLLDVRISSEEEDVKESTDMVLMIGGSVAIRTRRVTKKYRDWTIRAKRDTGSKTELAKIKEGFGKWYFYGWIDENDKISEWMIVDLDRARESGLFEREWPLIPNKDGTWFIAIPKNAVRQAGCLIKENEGNFLQD